MAQSINFANQTITIPGGYAQYNVQNVANGLASSGIITLVGESEIGPSWNLEADLDLNIFGPDQLADAIAKYGDGRLTDAMRQGIGPCLDPAITGSPSGFILVKTNAGTQASLVIADQVSGNYGTLFSQNYGAQFNSLFNTISDSVSEIVPGFTATYIPPQTAFGLGIRVDGGSSSAITVANSPELPAAVVSALNGVSGITATGGVAQTLLSGGTTVSGVVNSGTGFGTSVTFSIPGSYPTPSVGDTLLMLTNTLTASWKGAYSVTGTSTGTITAIKLADIGGTSGVVTTPTGTPSASLTSSDMETYTAINVVTSSTLIDGLGKSLEILQTSGSAAETLFYVPGTAVPSGVIATSTTPELNVSAAERVVGMSILNAATNNAYNFTAGGQVVLEVGYYTAATATMTIGVVNGVPSFSTTVSGGAGASIATTPLSQFSTVGAMATWISSKLGYYAVPFNATIGLMPTSSLDYGTFGIATSQNTASKATVGPGRIKSDATSFFNALSASGTEQLNSPAARASSGLPANITSVPLAGGTLGGTTEAQFQAAIDACQSVTTNFIVPLISQNASLDIASGLTDPSSTYQIDAVNSYVLKHCNFMFGPPNMGNRQGFLSKRDTLANCEQAAANLNSSLVSMAFQDIKIVEANGIVQEQPWANAVTAAAIQAAGFYQGIFFKSIDVSGAVQAAGDFNPKNRSQLTAALKSGLLIIQPVNGFRYVSDQTTYGTDNNPIYNSIQAIYAANLCALTLAQRMETAYVGKSLADTSASLALASIDLICQNLFNAKLIAASTGAPKGYTNASVRIVGPQMMVQLDLYVATCLYFVTINFNVQQIVQSA